MYYHTLQHSNVLSYTRRYYKCPAVVLRKAISGMHAEQETFLTALASDFNMEVPYLEYMVQAGRGIWGLDQQIEP